MKVIWKMRVDNGAQLIKAQRNLGNSMRLFAWLFVIALLTDSGSHAETGKHAHAMVILLPMGLCDISYQ